MSSRYVSRPKRAYYYSEVVGNVLAPQSITVVEVGESHEETGLLDARGNPLYRVKDQIGFRAK